MLFLLCFYQTKFGLVLKLVLKVLKKFSFNHFYKKIELIKNFKNLIISLFN